MSNPTHQPVDREITVEELKSHNTRASAWMAIRGKVFDVTGYADKHPGGYSTLKQGFGRDATTFFNQVHSYVSFERILQGRQVGVLVVTRRRSPSLPSTGGGGTHLAP